ncbi:uncharacterized protein TRIADDRAFT_20518 [Trichoplax adhaerens]|uniref:Rho GDP-dissociation inhibitor 3 n=1 Tax=Trichoplax adhaerens TaxID=10228 RepID=B3RMN4_TRIAD|nr:hypothetical protein TRIADDRAFT_20518 [Trichoplax adhaerens]EDV27881.1 hypothetical protein TRIADDRAFT_20518 [Trichoplax adhaerens]|eukprot:XP_002109715.1 hypothetical protein TRIADDRAFT_20518 [Trichoplax adhaerens]
MAEESNIKPLNEEPEETPGYKAPAQKSLDEIKNLDADDESLVKYKQSLLAGVDLTAAPKDDPRRVIVEKMGLVVQGRDDIELDLTGDLSELKEKTIVIKEGTEYRIKIFFKVHHEIVSGLRYHHAVSRKGISVDKQSYMVGSYGPKAEIQSYLCPSDEAPKGMIARGHYVVKSKFIDDDKNVHLAWEWSFDIKKDWE